MRTTSEWYAHFVRNAAAPESIPWPVGADLTPTEIRAVAASLREFQLGESSDGRNLQRCANRYAATHDDPDYAAAIRLFIAEEQRHGRDLGRVLLMNGIRLQVSTPLDSLFRHLRRAFDQLEVQITVLITAELIATVYYQALRAATRSRILQALCDRILDDEAQHVAFQSEQLRTLRKARRPLALALTLRFQELLLGGAICSVWCCHRRALRAGGWSWTRFCIDVWTQHHLAFYPKQHARPADVLKRQPDPFYAALPSAPDAHA